MTRRLEELQLACMMLTRLPAGRIAGDAPPLAGTVWAFPVIGLLVGASMAIGFSIAQILGLPPLAGALLALATASVVTGGLHEDGLADTADGFGGGATRDRKLEIMRDSRIGSYGVLALIFTLGLTASAIAASGTVLGLLAIAAASRTAMLLPMTLLQPARTSGLGHSAETPLDGTTLTAFALTLVLLIATGTLIAGVVMLASALALTAFAKRQIGGQTGDVLGATQKLTECTGWLTLAALA